MIQELSSVHCRAVCRCMPHTRALFRHSMHDESEEAAMASQVHLLFPARYRLHRSGNRISLHIVSSGYSECILAG